MTAEKTPKVLGFCAHSGTGKTTLLQQLIPLLRSRGIRIGVIKHAHHKFDTDQPGKDSYELRKAGATQMLISSSCRQALITEHSETDSEPTLNELIQQLDAKILDLILIEGFKHEKFPKIELHRHAVDKPPIYPTDDNVIAFASDDTPPENLLIPSLNLNNTDEITEFIVAFMRKT